MKHKILPGFIVLEGLDGSGTTTQLELLSESFNKAGIPAVPTCEPTDMTLGRTIRTVLKKEEKVQPETLARLFTADRNEHLYNPSSGIIRLLNEGKTVISDRYLFSSLAYQSLDLSFDLVYKLNRNFPLPRFLFFIDTSIEECQSRIGKRNAEELFEYSEIQERILENYMKAFKKYRGSGMNYCRINGNNSPEKINEEIWKIAGSAEK